MEIIFEAASREQQFEQILELQKQNLFSTISEEEHGISLQAYLRMEFEVISTYHDGKELWHVVAWDLEGTATKP